MIFFSIMPVKPGKTGKQKTKSAAKKRIRTTGSGKLAHEKIAHNHLLLQKSARQKNLASKFTLIPRGFQKVLNRLLSS